MFWKNVRIVSTQLGWEDHGIFTFGLCCEWEGGGVWVGNYALDEPRWHDPETRKKFDRRVGTAKGMDLVMRLLKVVGVSNWEELKGQNVRVAFEGNGTLGDRAIGIGHIIDEENTLIFKDHFGGSDET